MEMHDIPEHFKIHKYALLRSLVKEPTLPFFHSYGVKIAESARSNRGDPQMPGTPSVYGDPMMEMLMEELMPHIEEATALQVYPTYAYFRVYRRGDVLARHRDRPSCEISVTLNLGFQAEKPWPIWIEGPRGISCIHIHPGDAMLYRGIECTHWREAFDGDHAAQAFFHYVDRNGPYAEWKFDKRERLNSLRSLRRSPA